MNFDPHTFCHFYLERIPAGSHLATADFNGVNHKAASIAPSAPRATATSFSGWVFRLDRGPSKPSSLQTGLAGERMVSEQRNKLLPALHQLSGVQASDWECLYNDPLDNLARKAPFQSSLLTFQSTPLQCRPDLVLRHKQTGCIFIIETKVTRCPGPFIPEPGWANLAAQLWCYSWIDDWLDAPEVVLLGAVYQAYGNFRSPAMTPYSLRSSESLNGTCSALFRQFGGVVEEGVIKQQRLHKLKGALLDSELPVLKLNL